MRCCPVSNAIFETRRVFREDISGCLRQFYYIEKIHVPNWYDDRLVEMILKLYKTVKRFRKSQRNTDVSYLTRVTSDAKLVCLISVVPKGIKLRLVCTRM